MTESDVSIFLSQRQHALSTKEYETIMDYLLLIGEPWLHWLGRRSSEGILRLPDPAHRNIILPPRAKRLSQFIQDDHTFSILPSHEGNSLIQFLDPLAPQWQRSTTTGSIQLILQIPMSGFMRTFIFINPHLELSASPDLMTTVVKALPEHVVKVIEPRHIISHLSAKRCPAGLYDQEEVLVVCSALN
ncbi:hypothetical protein C8F01DRAFT_994467 [Mycena amicta]|nr:hypothetical protein C8F01DRAFT_994467 [Mycena amicta]